MSNILQASMEAIAFQKDTHYADEVTKLFQIVIDHIAEPKVVERALADLTSLTLDTRGIWMEGKWVSNGWLLGPYQISVYIPNFVALNPVNPKATKLVKSLDVEGMKAEDLINGTVDYAKAKMSGIYSKVRFDWMVSPAMFNGHFTAKEITALYIHELGHAWTNLSFMGETLQTNIILAEIVGQYDYSASVDKKYAVGKAAVKLSGLDIDLPKGTDISEITAMVLKGQVARMQRRAGTRWYDQRLSETIADQFTARFMMAGPLASALGKLERACHIFAAPGYEPIWVGVMFNLINVAVFPLSDMVRGTQFVILEGLRNLGMSFTRSILLSTTTQSIFTDQRYTPMEKRIGIIRREIVGLLRIEHADPEYRKIALKELAAIDDELSKVHRFSDVYTHVAKYITDLFSGREKELGRHDLIENLANNRLYEFSAKLKEGSQ